MYHHCPALKYREKNQYMEGVGKSIKNIGELFEDQNILDSAQYYYQKALMLARQNNMKRHEQNILFDYYELEQILGRHNAALKKYIGYSDVKDNINNKASELYFEELQLAFKMRNKEKQNKILRTENELKTLLIERKNLMIVVSILVIILLVVVIVLTYINLDRNKKANIQLQQFNREISDKNKSLIELNDKLYSIMVHELRNPLQWFRQITGMLNKKYEQMSPDKLKRTLQVLDDSANQSYHLMDNLLQWTRSQLGRVKCNPEPILLSDAIKFTPSGGEIYVVALMDANNKVKVEVHDKQYKKRTTCKSAGSSL
jgi:signal transduction histidine kinase